MEIGAHTCKTIKKQKLKCTLLLFKCVYYDDYSTKICGAEGFAFVLQNSNQNATGLAGSGLGYERIKDAFAVEFDFLHSTAKNDPVNTNGYHISVISRKGLATAAEDDSIISNYNPTNFMQPKETGVIYIYMCTFFLILKDF